jgi:tRNA threonylcarbamoyladenosine biosynthesis protein TsaB
LILAVSSATRLAGVALLRDGELLAELEAPLGRPHSELLMPLIDELLRGASRGLADVDAFAVAVGPGSFTGLRVGIATVKGLAFGSARAVAAVPTLRALAEAAPMSGSPVAAVLDAQRGEVYGAVFRSGEAAADAVWSAAELAAAVPPGALLVVGEGAEGAVEAAALPASVSRLPGAAGRLTAARVGVVGARLLASGAGVQAAELAARYVRRAEAEVRRTGERFEF